MLAIHFILDGMINTMSNQSHKGFQADNLDDMVFVNHVRQIHFVYMVDFGILDHMVKLPCQIRLTWSMSGWQSR